MNTIVTFKDSGQDFLRWIVAPDGTVLDCAPFQGDIWIGNKVTHTDMDYSGNERIILEKCGDTENYILKHFVKSMSPTHLSKFPNPRAEEPA
jgi:hypothetical protein